MFFEEALRLISGMDKPVKIILIEPKELDPQELIAKYDYPDTVFVCNYIFGNPVSAVYLLELFSTIQGKFVFFGPEIYSPYTQNLSVQYYPAHSTVRGDFKCTLIHNFYIPQTVSHER